MRLVEQDDGLWLWTIEEMAEDAEMIAVAEALKSGLTIAETAIKTGLTKSQVETRKKKAKLYGLL